MSHFSRIKTQMVEKELLLQALQDNGYTHEEGEGLKVRGFGGNKAQVDIKVSSKKLLSYDVGFRKNGNVYECIADWWGVRGINQQEFMHKVSQRYAYHAARAKLEAQGFSLVSEEIQEGNRIHLKLRRMA